MQRIRERDLTMKLVNVDYTYDGRKAVFYFTAENRIDFRDLVRDLANTLRVRVEMKQIGARDETKVTGGIGPCGRELCCSSWLRDFEAVTVKMAREQGLALNPSRLAGMCGRLKCCLRYEYCDLPRTQARPAQRRQARRIGQGRRQSAAPEHPQADRLIQRDEDGGVVEATLEDLVDARPRLEPPARTSSIGTRAHACA